MKTIRMLSVVCLAAFLVLQGLLMLTGFLNTIFVGIIGIIGLIAGVLIFISLGHWLNVQKDIVRGVGKDTTSDRDRDIFPHDKDRHVA